MPKFPLLLLDADVIICAHELGIWQKLADRCKITTTRSVVDEADFWYDDNNTQHPIELSTDLRNGIVDCVDVPMSQIDAFRRKFGPMYLDRMDPGETESLAFLYPSSEKWLICSGDAIVFKVLGSLGLAEQGISLEEVLQKIGLTCALDEEHQHYTKAYRLRLTKLGQQESITGMAFSL
jgi:hypothetical protein